MLPHKIVVRFKDGRKLRGYTANFDPSAPAFHLAPAHAAAGAKPEVVDLHPLKAVFFVRDFYGNPSRPERQHFLGGHEYQGREVQVEFADGEVMIGSTPSYDSDMPGFFIFPADPESNTIKVFAIASSVKSVHFLAPDRKPGPARHTADDARKQRPPVVHPGQRSGRVQPGTPQQRSPQQSPRPVLWQRIKQFLLAHIDSN